MCSYSAAGESLGERCKKGVGVVRDEEIKLEDGEASIKEEQK